MAETIRFRLPSAWLAAIFLAATQVTVGAQAPCSARPAQPDPGSRLAGNWHASPSEPLPAAKPAVVPLGLDLGIAPPNTRLDRMLLLLAPSPAQQQALDAFLQAQQTPGNCAYHQWLTPAQFADAFANSPSDVGAISAWLAQQGFVVAALPASRGWIEFSGSAAQVELAFGAAVHGYSTTAGTRYALTSGISVPAAFVPLIRGLVSLDGALSVPALTAPKPISAMPSVLAAETSPGQAEALTPQMVAPLLHLDALNASGVTGAGQTIAIASRSNIQPADVAAYRSTFGLPAGVVAVSVNGTDPGLTPDRAEAELAASWAGAAAPGARIVLVPSASTAATDGIDLSLAAIVDQDLAQTLVVDFSTCEAALGGAHQAFYNAVYRQASAEGISAIAAAGDSGAAACHAPGDDTPVTSGYSVNGLASTPWNTAVGTAAFAAPDGSAFSAWSPVSPADPAYAGGGGRSTAFSMPQWQASLPSASGGRMLPDLALATGVDSAFSRGLAFCFSGSAAPSGCTLVRSGGTSAAAAIFGGIAALIAQQDGPQGNLAPALYAASAQNGVFSDVQQGTATLACAAGSPDCDAAGQIGFAAGPGYDLATGLGAPNPQKLIAALANPAATGAVGVAISVLPNVSEVNPSTSLKFTATVTSQTGGATPTGTVNFVDSGHNLNSTPITLSGGQASFTTTISTPTGGHNIVASYSGDATYEALDSAPLTINIQPSTTTTTVTPATFTPTPGTAFNVTVAVAVGTPPAGAANPTGNITLTLDGANPQVLAIGANGQATFSETVTASGSHNLQATYAGDTNYQTSTSQVVTVNGANNTPLVTLSVSPVQTSYNPSATLTFTAVVASQDSGATPAGTITFTDQSTGQTLGGGPVTLKAGSASVTVNGSLPLNGNSIVAQYTPGTGSAYVSASSQVLTVNIQKSTTTTTVSSSNNNPTPGTVFNVTATIAVGTPPAGTANPTGQIQLTLDGQNYLAAQASTTGGVTSATFSVTVTSSGAHNLQAIYAGDGNFQTSTSQTVSVNGATETAAVTLSVAPAQPGNVYNPSATLTFTATVASQTGGPVPTGTVNFFDQATGKDLNATPVTLNPTGIATVVVNGGLPVNGNSILGQYTPATGSPYSATNSQALTVNIQPSGTTTTVKPSTATPAVGTPFPVTATVTIGTPPAGTANPSGQIQLTLDGQNYAAAPVATAAGVTSATFSVTVPTTGIHNLQAIYAGDTNYQTSTSTSVAVNGGAQTGTNATVTSLTANPATFTAGTPETFTAAITAAAGATATAPITGTVTFLDGTTQLGTATVTNDSATLANVTLTGATHSITAVYSGDTTWTGSTSNALTLKGGSAPVTVALSANPAAPSPGQAVTLTATVTPNTTPPSTGEQNPTGNVIFYNGTAPLGTVALTPAQGDAASASLSITALSAGQASLTAVYVGDQTFATATSNVLSLTLEDFTITPGAGNPPGDLDIVKGSSANASFVIAGLGGFKNQVNVVCNVPPQADITCAASPQLVTPTQTVTFTITTYATGGPSSAARHNPRPLWQRAGGGVAFAVLLVFLLPDGKRSRLLSQRGRRMLMLLVLLAGFCGAGIGCSSISPTVITKVNGTPLGETTLTITAATTVDNAVISHSAYLTVNVLPQSSTGTSQPAPGSGW